MDRYRMTELPRVRVELEPTNLDNLMSEEYRVKAMKLLDAHRAAPELVADFIAAAELINKAHAEGGSLDSAIRVMNMVRVRAESYRG